jgi:hypothetical protein
LTGSERDGSILDSCVARTRKKIEGLDAFPHTTALMTGCVLGTCLVRLNHPGAEPQCDSNEADNAPVLLCHGGQHLRRDLEHQRFAAQIPAHVLDHRLALP